MAESPRIEELKRRVQSDPASIAFAALAEEYRRAGRFQEAIDTCTAGLVRHPSYLSAHVTLGRALIDAGRLPDAKKELESVLKLAPENLAAIRGLAEIHGRLRDEAHHDRAEESGAAESAESQMTVAEIQAASGFAPPSTGEPAPSASRVEPPGEPPPPKPPLIRFREGTPEPVAPPTAEAPWRSEPPAPTPEQPAMPSPEQVPVSAAQPANVQLETPVDPALAGLEAFLNAILRARAQGASVR
jgi:tetratricopeptide (TPR) repeat protein